MYGNCQRCWFVLGEEIEFAVCRGLGSVLVFVVIEFDQSALFAVCKPQIQAFFNYIQICFKNLCLEISIHWWIFIFKPDINKVFFHDSAMKFRCCWAKFWKCLWNIFCFTWTTPTYRSRSFLLQPLLHWLRCYATQCLTQCPQAYKFGLIPSLLYIFCLCYFTK